jgi:hypothetical protein
MNLQGQKIIMHKTVMNTPQQIRVTKRMNRTLLERARCMLFNAGLGKEFWAKVISTACYLVNRSPTTFIECKTSEEVWSGKPADYSNLKVFDCPAYFHVNEGKLEPRTKKDIFVEYLMNVKKYKLWCPNLLKIFISRDITFDEIVMHPSR